MTWDVTVPLGSDGRGTLTVTTNYDGALQIRNFKTDVAAALATDAVFPGPVPGAPVFIHAFKYGATGARPAAGNTGRWYYNTTTSTIQRDNGTGWDDITAPSPLIPAGKKMVFYQNAAPTGWTQDATNNDRFIRIVTGAGGGTGGTDSIIAPPSHNHGAATGNPTASLAHAHSVSVAGQNGVLGAGTVCLDPSSPLATSTGTSADLPHTHTIAIDNKIAFTPKYADVIVCYR